MKKLKSNLFDSRKYFKDSDDYKILYLEDKNGVKITPSEAENSINYNYDSDLIDITDYTKIGLLYNGKEITLKLDDMLPKNDSSTFDHDINDFLHSGDFDDLWEQDYDEYYTRENAIIPIFNKHRKEYYNNAYPDIKYIIENNDILFPINNTDYEKEIIQNLINNKNFINDLSKFITNIYLYILMYIIDHSYIYIEKYKEETDFNFVYSWSAPYANSGDEIENVFIDYYDPF